MDSFVLVIGVVITSLGFLFFFLSFEWMEKRMKRGHRRKQGHYVLQSLALNAGHEYNSLFIFFF